jgi:WD40 repeat protein
VVNFKGHGGCSFWPPKGCPNALAFFPDGDKVVTGDNGGVVKIWESRTGLPINTIKAHDSFVLHVIVSPNEKILATVGGDKSIKLWDPYTGIELGSIKSNAIIGNIKFSPDSSILAMNCRSHVELWRIHQKKGFEELIDVFLLPLMPPLIGIFSPPFALDFSQKGNTIVASNNSAVVWDIVRRKKLWRYAADYNYKRGRDTLILDIAFYHDERILRVSTRKGISIIKLQQLN